MAARTRANPPSDAGRRVHLPTRRCCPTKRPPPGRARRVVGEGGATRGVAAGGGSRVGVGGAAARRRGRQWRPGATCAENGHDRMGRGEGAGVGAEEAAAALAGAGPRLRPKHLPPGRAGPLWARHAAVGAAGEEAEAAVDANPRPAMLQGRRRG